MKLTFEDIDCDHQRAKVLGGWLVKAREEVFITLNEYERPQTGYAWQVSVCFVPDPNHEWSVEPESENY